MIFLAMGLEINTAIIAAGINEIPKISVIKIMVAMGRSITQIKDPAMPVTMNKLSMLLLFKIIGNSSPIVKNKPCAPTEPINMAGTNKPALPPAQMVKPVKMILITMMVMSISHELRRGSCVLWNKSMTISSPTPKT